MKTLNWEDYIEVLGILLIGPLRLCTKNSDHSSCEQMCILGESSLQEEIAKLFARTKSQQKSLDHLSLKE